MAERSPTEGPRDRKEYSFEEGVAIAVAKMQALVASSKRDVVVVMNSPGKPNEGKTRLSTMLIDACRARTIPYFLANDDRTARFSGQRQLSLQKERLNKPVGVILVADGDYLGAKDRTEAIAKIEKTGFIVGDLYITIYRPDEERYMERLFNVGIVGDIVIRNEGAKEK